VAASSGDRDSLQHQRDAALRRAHRGGTSIDRARAILAHGQVACERHAGIWLYSTSTGRAYPAPCDSWRCSSCRERLRVAATVLYQEGCLAARARGHRVRMLTLTDGTGGDMDMAELRRTFKRLMARLTTASNRDRVMAKLIKAGELEAAHGYPTRPRFVDKYALVVEPTKRGALHVHMLATGAFIPQVWLSAAAEASGFGQVADVRSVEVETMCEPGTSAAEYLSKGLVGQQVREVSMATYLAKVAALQIEALADKVEMRVRPVRCSRGWFRGGFERAKLIAAEVRARDDQDPGPYEVVNERGREMVEAFSQLRRVRSPSDSHGRIPMASPPSLVR
jgi:hypothetical protein